jgi:hypothetical protein
MPAGIIPVSGFPLSVMSLRRYLTPRAILDGPKRRSQLITVKTMMLFLLGVRLLFLSAAGAMCVYGLLHAADPKVLWYWTVGHVLVLAACVFLIGKVWASLKATWKE